MRDQHLQLAGETNQKGGREMKIGEKIKDNDPRVGKRILKIIDFDGDYVIAKQGDLHSVRIRKDRIYSDGKARKNGFTLIGGMK